jgi:AcrR family transcriptional regulator
MREQDLETHARLLNAAAQLFAARGFKAVTVREI